MKKILHAFKKNGVHKVAVGGAVGYLLFTFASHPRSLIHKMLPEKKLKNLQFSPHIRVHTKEKTYHIHHWLLLSSLYLTTVTLKRELIFKSKTLHGFLLGSIIQGLSYQDRFQMVHSLPPTTGR